jgi:uncharacterized OB-fold protein
VEEVADDVVLARYPWAPLDHDNKHIWKGYLRKRLLVMRCRECGHWIHPAAPMCPRCWSEDVRPAEVSGKGTIRLLILLHQGPPVPGFDYARPLPVTAVELPEQPGLHLTSVVVDSRAEDLRIGMPVEVTWIEQGGAPVPAFRPAAAGGGL